MTIPGRALLDTNVVNFTLDWGEAIFDGGRIPEGISSRDLEDVLALRHIFFTGKRAFWQLAISPLTYRETEATVDPVRRAALRSWFGELWLYWRDLFEQFDLSDAHANSLAMRLEHSRFLAWLPQRSDRELLSHAISYGCDVFCTRDRKTILSRRAESTGIPLRFFTPAEWWHELRPYGSLFA